MSTTFTWPTHTKETPTTAILNLYSCKCCKTLCTLDVWTIKHTLLFSAVVMFSFLQFRTPPRKPPGRLQTVFLRRFRGLRSIGRSCYLPHERTKESVQQEVHVQLLSISPLARRYRTKGTRRGEHHVGRRCYYIVLGAKHQGRDLAGSVHPSMYSLPFDTLKDATRCVLPAVIAVFYCRRGGPHTQTK